MFLYGNILKELYRYNPFMSSKDLCNNKIKEKEYLKEFGKNIKFLRINKAHKSLRIFAYENDIPCATLSRIENGLRIPNLIILKRIAAGYSLDVSSFIANVEENIPNDLKNFEL